MQLLNYCIKMQLTNKIHYDLFLIIDTEAELRGEGSVPCAVKSLQRSSNESCDDTPNPW